MIAETWTLPDLGSFYLLCDDDNQPVAVCRLVDLLCCLESCDDWPSNQYEYDDLLFAFNAWELDE